MLTGMILMVAASSSANVVVLDGAACGVKGSDEVLIRVLEGQKDVSSRIELSTGVLSDKGELVMSDLGSGTVGAGKGYIGLKWKPLDDIGEKLVTAGWTVLKVATVYVRDEFVASISFERSRKGGRCLPVQT